MQRGLRVHPELVLAQLLHLGKSVVKIQAVQIEKDRPKGQRLGRQYGAFPLSYHSQWSDDVYLGHVLLLDQCRLRSGN